MGRYPSVEAILQKPLLGVIPEECAVDDDMYLRQKQQQRQQNHCSESSSSLWRDVLMIWIVFPGLLIQWFHAALSSLQEEIQSQGQSWQPLPVTMLTLDVVILMFSASAWLYRRNLNRECEEQEDDDDDEGNETPLWMILLPETFLGFVLILLGVRCSSLAFDVLLLGVVVLTAMTIFRTNRTVGDCQKADISDSDYISLV